RWIRGNVIHVEETDAVSVATVLVDEAVDYVQARFVIDASGRSGVLARRKRRSAPGHRTHAWIGTWDVASSASDDQARTLVETTDDFWSWSGPTTATSRSVTVMLDPDRTRIAGRGPLLGRYVALLERARHVPAVVGGGRLRALWGCDASTYEANDAGSDRHLVIGDALSFIDPLSSVGVKKALTSAWMAASVVHTCLVDP